MTRKSRIKPISHLKNRTAEVVREVCESGSSMIITQNGEAKVVVMDIATYDRWRDALALLKILSQSQKDVEAGALLSEEEAFARAEAAIGKAEN